MAGGGRDGRWKTIVAFAAVGAFAGWAAWRHQFALLYMPRLSGAPATPRATPAPYRSPSDWNLPFRDVRATDTLGNRIHAWVIPARDRAAPTVLFFHGNALHMGYRLPNMAQLVRETGCSVVMMDYCGYGESEGAPGEDEVVLAGAQAVLDHVLGSDDVNAAAVVLYGRSLGGAVAAQLAARNSGKVRGLVLENTFLGVREMATELFSGWISPALALLLRMHWRTADVLGSVPLPVLLLAGDRDEIVPHRHMLELHRIAREGAAPEAGLHIVRGGRHNDLPETGGDVYWAAIKQFLAQRRGARL